MRLPMLLSSSLLVLSSACAGSISGEVDGEGVPAFGSAAFGLIDNGGAGFVFGLSLPGDSCEKGSELFDVSSEGDADETADFINENIPVGSWFMVAVVAAADEDDLADGEVTLDDQDDGISAQISICKQEDEAEEDDAGAECFIFSDGEIKIELSDDEERVKLSGQELEVSDEDGDDAGEVGLDITFSRCEDIEDEIGG